MTRAERGAEGVRHHDDALALAHGAALSWLGEQSRHARVLLVDDLIGRLTAVVWTTDGKRPVALTDVKKLSRALKSAAPFFRGDVIVAEAGDALWEGLWREAEPVRGAESGRLRVAVRTGDHLHWFSAPRAVPERNAGPRTAAFLSFKGGVGRTTVLAAFAVQRARQGEHVVVVDLDLDAPGVGTLLRSDPTLPKPEVWGVVDFMLDSVCVPDLDIREYLHECGGAEISDRGSIRVMGAGAINERYLSKMARADLDASLDAPSTPHRLTTLLEKLAAVKPTPDWILLDGRAGFSTTVGLLLHGLADVYVLVATASEQSYAGVERFVDRLGARRLLATPPLPQAECVVVHSMVPANSEVAKFARARFDERLEKIFVDGYYAAEPDAEDRVWSVADVNMESAPHRPVALRYDERLAFFRDLDEVAEHFATDREYVAFGKRLCERFPPPGETDDGVDE